MGYCSTHAVFHLMPVETYCTVVLQLYSTVDTPRFLQDLIYHLP